MFGHEVLKSEGKIIIPKVQLEARELVVDQWGIDHALLDQFSAEVLVDRRFDMPLTLLSELVRQPVLLTRDQHAGPIVWISNYYDGGRKFGDCGSLCYQVGLDDRFWAWLSKIKPDSGLITPYLMRGYSPQFFRFPGQQHYWLSLLHHKTGTILDLDPSFQVIGTGSGYEVFEDGAMAFLRHRLPKGILGIQRILGQYKTDTAGKIISTKVGEPALLGMTKSKKILGLEFAAHERGCGLVTILAYLLDRYGLMKRYYFSPETKVILDEKLQKPPEMEDLETLASFFSIAGEFVFVSGH